MLKWLMTTSEELQSEAASSLYAAMRSGKIDKVKDELARSVDPKNTTGIDWNFRDPNQRTLLHMGAMIGDTRILYQLKNVPVNAKDDRGYTALHYTIMMHGSLNVLAYLIERSVSVNLRSNQGHTAYDIAEILWQYQRISYRRRMGEELFRGIFEKGLDVLLKKTLYKDKWNQVLKNNPALGCFLKKNHELRGLFLNKAVLLAIGAELNKPVDASTFIEPYFIHYGLPLSHRVYWSRIPKQVLSDSTVEPMSQREKDEILFARNPLDLDGIFYYHTHFYGYNIELSYQKGAFPKASKSARASSSTNARTTTQDKTPPSKEKPSASEQAKHTQSENVSGSQRMPSASEYSEDSAKRTHSVTPSRPSGPGMSAINHHLECGRTTGDEFSEYSVISSSTSTTPFFPHTRDRPVLNMTPHPTKRV